MSIEEDDTATATDADDVEGDADADADPEATDDQAFASLLARLAAAPRNAAPLLSPGALLGHFRVETLLGRGGMGEVWRALDTRLQRPVALKVLRRSAQEARLLEEARAAAAVHHARVATVFEVGEAEAPFGELGFIALELVPGDTLRKRLRAGPLPVRAALNAALDAAQGLAAVHGRGLVHRDIKPDNLAFDASGHVKLLDFGIASVAGTDASAWGTPRYMPPEQRALGGADARADVFALAVTLVELLSGAAPFDDEGDLRAELRGDPLRELRALPGLPPAVLGLLARCLYADASARPASAAALVEELATALAPAPTLRERAAPWVTLGTAAALTALFFSLVPRVEDAVAADLPTALASAPEVSRDARVRARFRAAADAMLAGDNLTAAAALAEVVQSAPESPWGFALLVLSGESARAGVTHEQALAEVRRRADGATRQGRAALALAALGDARTLAGPQPVPPDSAAAALGRAALDEAGDDAFSAVLFAATLPWRGEVQEKLDRIDAALSRDARVALLWRARAEALRGAARPPEAIAAAQEGLARVPGNVALEDALLRARLAAGEADAVEDLVMARLRAHPEDLDAQLLRLDVAAARGELHLVRAGARHLLEGPFARASAARAVAELALRHLDPATDPVDLELLDRALATLREAGLVRLADSGRTAAGARER
ncbi:MAG: serine/threonine protein kinase [Deltaproteobacteria bacterium]|nr:serine/threonine protein kinase [Deltaproteobacteria bacterium]